MCDIMSARVLESADSAARISASLITASCNSASCVANVSHAAGQCAKVVIRLRRMAASDAQRGGIETGTIYHSLQRASMSRGPTSARSRLFSSSSCVHVALKAWVCASELPSVSNTCVCARA